MNVKTIKDALNRTPFRSFKVETTGSKIIPVRRPELVFIVNDFTLIISDADHLHLIDADYVASLHMSLARRKAA